LFFIKNIIRARDNRAIEPANWCNSPQRARLRHPWILLLIVCAGIFFQGWVAALDPDRLLANLRRLGGDTSIFAQWRKAIDDASAMHRTEDKLRRVNEFFDRRIQFAEDQESWGQSDYWATPMETLAKGKGDCEDFTIAKYFTLLNAGVPDDELRLVYVKARLGGPNSTVQQAHMVLAWYATPDAEPLVLDNLIVDIRPASRRADLTPVFSFNSQGIWQGNTPAGAPTPGGIGRLSRWQDLLRRARLEGFD
jgi:predicted transglutaminase-like cysteine proteinase